MDLPISLEEAQCLVWRDMHQWFDIWSLEDTDARNDLQYDGLGESIRDISALLRKRLSLSKLTTYFSAASVRGVLQLSIPGFIQR
jgi:hypothetical protein